MPEINVSDKEAMRFIKQYLDEHAGMPQLLQIGRAVIDNVVAVSEQRGSNDNEVLLNYAQKKLGAKGGKGANRNKAVFSNEDWEDAEV